MTTEWTVATLAEHLATRLSDLDRRLQERWETQEEQRRMALHNLEERLSAALTAQQTVNVKQNEFRGALEDQAQRVETSMLPRREYDERSSTLLAAIDVLRDESRRDDHAIGERLVSLRQEFAEELAALRLEANRDMTSVRQQITEAPKVERDRKFTTRISIIGALAALLYVVVPVVTVLITNR